MQLLLLKDVRKLGHVGDVVDVTAGYARNYLMPQRLATEPTEENIKSIDEEKKRAAGERARRNKEFAVLAEKLKDVAVTIEAAANPEGTLYGSVSAARVAEALHALGHPVRADHILLDPPIRTLDNRVVTIEFTDEISTQIKVWVVREGAVDRADESSESAEPAGSADAEDGTDDE